MLKALALVILMQVPAPTQELAPGTRYDTSIPTLEQVAGHDFGAEITAPDQPTHRLIRNLLDPTPRWTRIS